MKQPIEPARPVQKARILRRRMQQAVAHGLTVTLAITSVQAAQQLAIDPALRVRKAPILQH